jgi:hypothetical protein
MVKSRHFVGTPLKLINQTLNDEAWLATDTYLIYIKQVGQQISAAVSLRSLMLQGTCSQKIATRADCGHPAMSEEQCKAKQCCWNTTAAKPGVPICYFPGAGPVPPHPSPSPAPDVVWSVEDLKLVNNTLWWPEPLQQPVYAIKDRPRMIVPPWGPAPPPPNASIDPALWLSNGYDWRNDVDGDTYLFLGLDHDADSWHASRRDFLALTGPTPLLPDWAFGTWYFPPPFLI